MKVFLLGLDGLTLNMVKPYIEAGLLPNLKKVLDEGAYGILRSTIPPVSGPAWISLTTGKNPGKHGIFEFRTRQGYSTELVTKNTSIHAEPIWKILSRNQKCVSVINVPLTYPPDEINGMMISGLMTPDKGTEFTYPASIKEELFRLIPDYQVDVNTRVFFSRDKSKWLKEILKITNDRRTAMNHFIKQDSWDLFFIVYVAPDRLQHFQWNEVISMDPECIKCYQLLDNALGDILEKMDDDTVLFIVSDHGFETVKKALYLTTFLSKIGLLNTRQRKGFSKTLGKIDRSNKFVDWIIALLGSIFLRVKKHFPSWLMNCMFRLLIMPQGNMNWGKTKLFTILGAGIIFVNLKGREPQGIVEQRDYAGLCALVEKELLALKDPDTGKSIVKAVHKGCEIYSSEYADIRPDLVVAMNDGYDVRAELGNSVLSEYSPTGRKIVSAHHKDGLFAAYGNIVKKTRVDADIYDIMPTILYLAGVAIPEDVDGRVLTEIINRDFVEKNEIRFEKTTESYSSEKIALDEEEKKEVEKHLKNLGYLS
jgi:predicted AlkP superfamily phosphohydrolase/phosphomutase